MTLPFSIEIVPVMWVFWAWAALSIGYFLHGASTRRGAPPVSVSPFISERSAQARRGEISRQRFGPRGWAHMLFATGIAGVLLYLANAGSLWAAVFFAVASLWLIYDHVATPIALSDIGSDMVDTLDRAYYATGVAVWAYALACILFPNGKLLSVLP
jgi:hypothetical protein